MKWDSYAGHSSEPHPFKNLSDEYKSDKLFFLKAVQIDSNSIEYANNEIKNDKQIALTACKNSVFAFEYIGEKLRNDSNFVMSVIKVTKNRQGVNIGLHDLGKSLLNNEKFLFNYLKTSKYLPSKYEASLLPKSFKNDEKIIKKLIKINEGFLFYTNDKIREKYIDLLIRKNGDNLTKVNKKFHTKKNILKAAKTYGYIIRYVDKKFGKDKQIIIECLKNQPLAFEYADERYQKDQSIIKKALAWEDTKTNADSQVMRIVGKNIKTIQLAKFALDRRGDNYCHLNKKFKDNKKILIYALKRDGGAYYCAKKIFQRDLEIINIAKKTGVLKRYKKTKHLPLRLPEDIHLLLKYKDKKKQNKTKEVKRYKLYTGGYYWGTLLNDQPHGYGFFSNEDKEYLETYEGMWKNGKHDGEGVSKKYNEYSDTLWEVYKGSYKNGKPHGKGEIITYNFNGKIYTREKGIFKNGNKHGKIKVFEKRKWKTEIYKNGNLVKW